MLRYLGGVLAGFLAAVLIWAGLLFASFGFLNTHSDRMLDAWFRVKADAARKISVPKIVLAGGSNVLYGLRASRIEQQLGVPCINFGTHAGLPLDFLLLRLRSTLKSGDLVVLSPEWDFLGETGEEVNDVFSGLVLGGDPRFFWNMGLRRQTWMLFSAPAHRIFLPMFSSASQSDAIQSIYNDWVRNVEFDANGDFILNDPAQRTVDALADLQKSPIDWSKSQNKDQNKNKDAPLPEFWNDIKRFLSWARAHHVQVYYSAPALIAFDRPETAKNLAFFADAERRFASLGVPVLVRQVDNVYPAELMFDTIYHLNANGAQIRTDRLIQALKPIARAHFAKP